MKSERPLSRVLVVDDTPATLSALCELLVEEHEVMFGTSGAEALEIAFSQQPDLILLDVVMVGMDGYEVCTRLKADSRTSDIPVLFITSMGEEVDQERGLAAGAIDYIQKPISPLLVKARVRNHLGLKREQDRLKNLTKTDGLTGIANRRHFDETLREEWMRCVRTQKPLSLIMIDLDHFKMYNDAYGHAAGDDCLKSVAAAMQKSLQRTVDLAARYGGEEFVCLLSETDATGALQVAERLSLEVAALALPHRDSQVAPVVTLSQGVATLVPLAGGHPESLILEADSALYQSKNSGRNRITQTGTGPSPAPLSGEEKIAPALPTVLLVEDDKHMRSLMAARLGFLRANLEAVSSAQEALTFLAQRKAQLILSDVVMPGMDGFVLCQRLKEDPVYRKIPFVLLTSLSRNLRERSAQAGADDRLSKQEDDVLFRMRIRYLLELGTLPAEADGAAEVVEARLALVSPSATVRTQLAMHLQPAGVRVLPFDSVEGALGELRRGMPDLFCLDLDPALGDSAEALQRMRNLPGAEGIPCLVLAQKGEESFLPPLEDKIEDCLSKPLDAQDVRHRTKLLVRLARARRLKVQA